MGFSIFDRDFIFQNKEYQTNKLTTKILYSMFRSKTPKNMCNVSYWSEALHVHPDIIYPLLKLVNAKYISGSTNNVYFSICNE